MEGNREENLLKGNKHRWDPIREILASHFVGTFQKIVPSQEAEGELEGGCQFLQ
jgi:hypothetical protein